MAVEVHPYLVDVQSLRTFMLSILFWISDKSICGEVTTSLFFLGVRSIIVCSTYLCRSVDNIAVQLQ